jgi:hypothetical protein
MALIKHPQPNYNRWTRLFALTLIMGIILSPIMRGTTQSSESAKETNFTELTTNKRDISEQAQQPALRASAPPKSLERVWRGVTCYSEQSILMKGSAAWNWCRQYDSTNQSRCLSVDPHPDVVPGELRPETNFCFVRKGVWDKRITSEDLWGIYRRLKHRRRDCTTVAALTKSHLEFNGDDVTLSLSPECGGEAALFSYTPDELLAVLHVASQNGTRTIFVSGDSMMRQFVGRLMYYLRGVHRVIEWRAWVDYWYCVSEDSDEFTYVPVVGDLFHEAHRSCPNTSKPIVQIQYIWMPEFRPGYDRWITSWIPKGQEATADLTSCGKLEYTDDNGQPRRFRAELVPAVLIHAHFYWNPDGTLDLIPKYIRDVAKLLTGAQNLSTRCKKSLPFHFVEIKAPNSPDETPEQLISMPQNNIAVERSIRNERKALQLWSHKSIVRDGQSMTWLEFDTLIAKMDRNESRRRRRDCKHFQCVSRNSYPDQYDDLDPNSGDTAEVCADPINLHLWSWLATVLISMN